jgi:hypothetical protein
VGLYLKLTISSLKEKRNIIMKITVRQLKQLIREQVEEVKLELKPTAKVLTVQQAFDMLVDLAPVDAQDGVTLDAAHLAGMGITPGILKGVMELADKYHIYWMTLNDDGSVELVDPLSQ